MCMSLQSERLVVQLRYPKEDKSVERVFQGPKLLHLGHVPGGALNYICQSMPEFGGEV
jgi:hypothetical protein